MISLKKNNLSDLLMIRANFSQKKKRLQKKSYFSLVFPFFMPNSDSLSLLFTQSLIFKELWEQFPLVSHYKRATVRKLSNSLRSLMTKERWKQFPLFHKRIALSLTKYKRFARKSDEQTPNPGYIMYFSTIYISLIYNLP